MAVCLSVMAGCSNGKLSGETETRTIGVPCTYSTLQVNGNATIVANSMSNVVTVTVDRKLIDLVKVKGTDRKLTVDASAKKVLAAGTDAIIVNIPISRKLDNVKFTGASRFEFSDIVMCPDLKIESKGSNVFNGVMTLEKLIIKSEGADVYDIDLNCETVKIEGNGSAVFGSHQTPMMTNDADVDLKGACVAYIAAPGKCTGNVDGNSELHAFGDFNYNKVKTSASGKVIHEDFLK